MFNSFRSQGLSIAGLGVVLTLGLIAPVKAASISFVSAGSQLDTDSINDINTFEGRPISFDVQLDTTGLIAPLTNFVTRFDFDTTELSFTGVNQSALDQSFFGTPGVTTSFDFLTGIFSVTTTRTGFAPINTTYTMFTDNFTVLPGVNNDGLADYRAVVLSATDANGTDVTSLFNPNEQVVEVQSVPEPNLILAMGVTMGLIFLTQKRKQTLKS